MASLGNNELTKKYLGVSRLVLHPPALGISGSRRVAIMIGEDTPRDDHM